MTKIVKTRYVDEDHAKIIIPPALRQFILGNFCDKKNTHYIDDVDHISMAGHVTRVNDGRWTKKIY